MSPTSPRTSGAESSKPCYTQMRCCSEDRAASRRERTRSRVEALTGHPDMFQTASSQAQEIERQIQRVWSAYRLNPSAHANALPLLSRFEEIATEIARRPLAFDDWHVVYRQVLQLRRAPGGGGPIPQGTAPEGDLLAAREFHPP